MTPAEWIARSTSECDSGRVLMCMCVIMVKRSGRMENEE